MIEQVTENSNVSSGQLGIKEDEQIIKSKDEVDLQMKEMDQRRQIEMQRNEQMKINEQRVVQISFGEIMTQEFVKIYRQCLSFSGLEMDSELRYRNVLLPNKQHIHELYTRPVRANQQHEDDLYTQPNLPHLVLLHGFGGSSLMFVRMLKELSVHFYVHALDTLGVGLSSRQGFREDYSSDEAIDYFVGAVEEWRKQLNLQTMVLAGHSFGGYIAALYSQKHADRVNKLILVSPAGATEESAEEMLARYADAPMKRKIWHCVIERFYNMQLRPYRLMRMWVVGPRLIDRILTHRLHLEGREKEAWAAYISAVAALPDSSETGFYKLLKWPLMPVRSIEKIVNEGHIHCNVHFIFGQQDWMNAKGGRRLAQSLDTVTIDYIQDAGHQIIFDNPNLLTQTIIRHCK